MSKAIKIRKGVDIKLIGEADKVTARLDRPEVFALKPTDFHGLVPKVVVKEGQEVKAGTVLFLDKYNERIRFTSPVSGEVAEVKRGDKRKVLEIKILADREDKFEDFGAADPKSLSREAVIEKMLNSGVWPLLRQRPFSTIANPEQQPKAIFISAVDSAPLAADSNFVCKDKQNLFQKGIDALTKLTSGKVHLNVWDENARSSSFTGINGVQLNKVNGPHPAGNVGVQIHHIDPINKGEVIWYLYPQDVLTIGRLFHEGHYNAARVVALCGSEVKQPKYYETTIGAQIKKMTSGNISEGDIRIISGNVLTGSKVAADSFVGFYDTQITVIPEGHEPQFFLTEGWLSPGFHKFSISKSFPSWVIPGKKYRLNTNLNGEHRAFVVTGEMEKVFPFDIYPMQLVKSIMINDIDMMEKLGIYEVDSEDFALCEFVCTSKIDIQDIVRGGLDVIQKEFA
jgi:Na+-transporting NADH:ubiquinone oxidoreductase subunit A